MSLCVKYPQSYCLGKISLCNGPKLDKLWKFKNVKICVLVTVDKYTHFRNERKNTEMNNRGSLERGGFLCGVTSFDCSL